MEIKDFFLLYRKINNSKEIWSKKIGDGVNEMSGTKLVFVIAAGIVVAVVVLSFC